MNELCQVFHMAVGLTLIPLIFTELFDVPGKEQERQVSTRTQGEHAEKLYLAEQEVDYPIPRGRILVEAARS